ncbi:MAG: hypothetical protein KF866_10980 [Phycisphaeraceae bacterium]|nr:hypothetical protein [Phycisphaeraceae bacterium]
MSTRVLAGLATLTAAALPALGSGVLWNNGPFVTHPGLHTSGADISRLQNVSLGDTTLGFSGHLPTFRIADDFTVPTGQTWTVQGVHVFSYRTGNTTGLTGGNVRIWQGDPGAGGTIVYDGSAVNTLVSSTFANAYRISENAANPNGDVARPIFDSLLSIPNVVLGPGQYWVDWQLDPAPLTTVFLPPVTISGQGNTAAGGAARQSNAGNWSAQLVDSGNGNPKDMPFILIGVPTPGAIAVFGLAGIAACRRRRA